MPRINILDKHTAELIAAGEVVERPSSVVKELAENCVDAGAKSVTVEISNGGISYIRVTDDGCGILREDIKKAFIPHATSKIVTESDLAAIGTLGFRGEALASVAAVAKVDVLTKTPEENFGTRYVIEGGEEKLLDDAGCPNGTTVIVRDLFFNTPARMKFLKKNVSEANAVADVLDRMALSHPEVSFRFIREGKETLFTAGDGNLYSTIYSVYGKEFTTTLIPVEYESNGVKISGFVSKPLAARKTRSMQLFFINGRFVKSNTASAALSEAYRNSIMVGKFPACVLHIDFPLNQVDVNVHPAKIEVRFSNEKPVFDTVYYGVKTAISKHDTRPEINLSDNAGLSKNPFLKKQDFFKKNDTFTEQRFNMPSVTRSEIKSEFNPSFKSVGKTNIDVMVELAKESTPPKTPNNILSEDRGTFKTEDLSLSDDGVSVYGNSMPKKKDDPVVQNKDFINQNNLVNNKNVKPENAICDIVTDKPDVPEPRLIGEAFSTYIIVEVGKKLLLIDKHAAHERIIYNKLCEHHNAASAQMLMEPVTVTLRKTEYNLLLDNKELLEKAGIIAEDFGIGSVIIRSVPMCLDSESVSSLIEEVIDRLSKNPNQVSTEKLDWIYHSIACRAAVKAGDKSDFSELMVLAAKIIEDDNIRYCPHGRPVAIWLSKHELEKQFGRV